MGKIKEKTVNPVDSTPTPVSESISTDIEVRHLVEILSEENEGAQKEQGHKDKDLNTVSEDSKKKEPTKRILKYARPQQVQKQKQEITRPIVKQEPEPEVILPSLPKPVKKTPEIKITKVGQAVVIQERDEESFSIYILYQEMRENCVISDRWCIPEPMWDPLTDGDVLLCYEVDVLLDGSVRMKRCIKILENFEVVVLLDGSDKTHLFKERHPTIKSSQELCDLIRKVTMVKVCSGIKDCDPTEFDNISDRVIERAGSWYSTECNVEVEKGCLGNICRKCTSLRNSLRRKMRRQFGIENTTPTTSNPRSLLSNTLKPVMRSLGEALYSNMRHMCGNSSSDEVTIPTPRSATQVLHPDLKIYMNTELKSRLDEVAANPPPLTKIEHIVEFDTRTMTKTVKRIHSPITSFRNTVRVANRTVKRSKPDLAQSQSFVMGNNGELTLVSGSSGETIELPEGYVLADESQWGDNVVVQKIDGGQEEFVIGDDNSIIVGSNFTLEDGEEYEVIGEAPSGDDSIQVLPLGNNSDIEIIEVDENMIQLVDEQNQTGIQPVDATSDIFKFLQAHSRLQGV